MRYDVVLVVSLVAAWLVLGPVCLSLAEDPDDWRLSHVRRMDYRWYRTPPRVIDPIEATRLGDELGLSESQRAAFSDLVDARTGSFTHLWLECAELYDDSQYSTEEDEDTARELHEEMERRRRECLLQHDEAGGSVLADLRLILTSEQDAIWDEVIRAHRRRTLLVQFASDRGEAVDLTELVKLMDLAEATHEELSQTLRDYTMEMDAALSARLAARVRLEEACRRFEQLRSEESEKRPSSKLKGLLEDVIKRALLMRERSKRLRAVNDRFTTLVSVELGVEQASQLEEMLAKTPNPMWGYWNAPRGLRMLKFAESLGTAGMMYQGLAAVYDSPWYTDVGRIASSVEPLAQAQLEKIRAMREEFEQAQMSLMHQHGMVEFESMSKNYLRIRCREGMVYLSRKEREDVDERRRKAQEQYGRELGALSDDTVRRLRKILTTNQRILLQTQE